MILSKRNNNISNAVYPKTACKNRKICFAVSEKYYNDITIILIRNAAYILIES